MSTTSTVSTLTAKPLSPGQQKLMKMVIKPMSNLNTWLFRMSGGRIGGSFAGGAPVLLLTTTGRKSGQPRTAPLLYLEDEGNIILVASQGGMTNSPQWYHNLEANPEAEVELGKEKKKVRSRRATDEEKAALWPKLVAMYKDYDLYQARTERNIPVMILSPIEG
jgi:deazaflavin-dependent oxidoreductase (nitroreductase family)